MKLSDYHSAYYAHEMTKRCPSGSLEKLAGALVDAQVVITPHQVEAALFAFRSPLSRGAMLADGSGTGMWPLLLLSLAVLGGGVALVYQAIKLLRE